MINPDLFREWTAKALQLQIQGKKQEAVDCYKQAIVLNPSDEVTRLNLGMLLNDLNQYDQAIQNLDESICLNPQNLKAYQQKALAFKKLFKYEDALICYEKVIEIDPKQLGAKLNLCILLDKLNQNERAIKVLDECIMLYPHDAKAYNMMGLIQYKNGNFKEAINYFLTVIKLNPNSVQARLDLSGSYLETKQYEQGIIVLDECLKLEPDNACIYNNKGIIYRNLSKFNTSLKCFDQAIQYDELFIIAYTNRAEVELELGYKYLAQQSSTQAQLLLQNPDATIRLNDIQLQIIRENIKKILFLLMDDNEELEFAVSQKNNIKRSTKESEIFESFVVLRDRKKSVISTSFRQIQDSVILTPQQTQHIEEPVDIKSLIENINKIQLELKELRQFQEITTTILQRAGTYETASIKTRFCEFQQTSPRLYDYSKSFYWTMLSYFNAFRTVGTGEFIDYNFGEDKPIVKEGIEKGIKLAKHLPVVGNLFLEINKAIEFIQGQQKKRKNVNIRNAVNNIIQNNGHVRLEEDISRSLALTALEIADRKFNKNENYELKDQIKLPKVLRVLKYVEDKIDSIKDLALGEKIELYTTDGGKEALTDVLLLLIKLTSDHDQIVLATEHKSLYLILADLVEQKSGLVEQSYMDVSEDQFEQQTQGSIDLKADKDIDKVKKNLFGCQIM